MAKSSKGKTKGRASRTATRGATRQKGTTEALDLDAVTFDQRNDTVETGYVIESFEIHRADVASGRARAARIDRKYNFNPDEFVIDDGWSSAYARTHPGVADYRLIFEAFRGHLVDWGVVVGIDPMKMHGGISAAVEAMEVEELYPQPMDEATQRREFADHHVEVAIALVFNEFIWPLVAMAVDAASRVASIVGRDVAAAPERYGLSRKALPVRKASAAEREHVTRSAAEAVRDYVKSMLRDPDVVRRVGRRVEAERDHRAYCMRERLVHSEEFMSMQRNARYALARERVIAEVIAPSQGGCSPANFQRIMDSGKAIHKRTLPNVAFCERWPLALEPSRK